jgi:hypothetical protein
VEALSEVVQVGSLASSSDGRYLAMRGRSPSASVFSLFVRPMAAGGRLVEVAREDDRTTIRGPGFTFTPDNKHLLYAVQGRDSPYNAGFRVVPVEGGTPRSIPLQNVQIATFHPDGHLAYTAFPGLIQETWMIRDLPLK